MGVGAEGAGGEPASARRVESVDLDEISATHVLNQTEVIFGVIMKVIIEPLVVTCALKLLILPYLIVHKPFDGRDRSSADGRAGEAGK